MAKRKKSSFAHKLMMVILAIPLIAVVTACLCGVALAFYIGVYVIPNSDIDVSSYSKDLAKTTVIYAKNPDTDEYEIYETLEGDVNRQWVSLDEIPEDLQKAVVAIEDQRFYSHHGVDWFRTLGAIQGFITGDDRGGGSTITQQLIKNLTGNNDRSVKRKINEIFQALTLEKNLGDTAKDQILEMYLNTIPYGNRAAGAKVAAMTYFGKELDELNLAECAVLAAIPNAPTRYNPFRNPENVKERQTLVLQKMLELEFITQAEYDEAINTELVYHSDAYEQNTNEPYSWFTEAIISELTEDLQETENISYDLARSRVMSGGLQIYATIDQNVQDAMDEVFTNEANFPSAQKNGVVPQAAMVVCDKQGNILGLVGGRGEKEGSLLTNRATMTTRQPGSSIKPLAVYGPAMDAGKITPYSVVTDMPFKVYDGKAWPRNDNRRYQGQMVVKNAVAKSINCVAVRVLDMLTPQASYEFLHNTLGFEHLNPSADIDYAPLALGGMNGGVTVREMAAGYTIFANNGKYSGSRTYSKVLDSEGNVLIDYTEPEEINAFQNEKTAYYMLDCLKEVTNSGTGTKATISGIETAGKTGTTTSKRDVWFCGLTPYYVGATWFGYDQSYNLDGISGNTALSLWTAVMRRIHADLPDAEFDMGDDSNFVNATYCIDSGMSPTDACEADSRGDRVAVGRFWKGDEPSEDCNLHKYVTICRQTGLVAGDNCRWTSTESKLDLTRLFPMDFSPALEDADACFTGDNDPVGSGDVTVSGGYLGVCHDRHSIFDFGNDDKEEESSEGTEGTEGETGTDSGNTDTSGGSTSDTSDSESDPEN